jgi:hypothetical protein
MKTIRRTRHFVPDPALANLPEVRDENGKLLPKEITLTNAEPILNDWWVDTIAYTESPEDDIIDAIDRQRAAERGEAAPPEKPVFHVGDKKLSDFDVWEEAKKSLQIKERELFNLIFMQGMSFRAVAKQMGIAHCIVYKRYKSALAKLGRGIMKRHLLED